jgi:hypothetical protein
MLCKLIIDVQKGMPGVETRKVGSKDRQNSQLRRSMSCLVEKRSKSQLIAESCFGCF